MMIKVTKSLCSLGWVMCLMAGTAQAASWQDQLSSAASDLMSNSQGNHKTSASADEGLSLATVTQLLNGSNNNVAASSLTNATGILQYCIKNNVLNNVNSVTDQLKSKLGLQSQTQQSQDSNYQSGISGLLNTANNQKLDLNALGETELGKQLKTKACNVVLNQGKSYLGIAQ